MQIDSDLYSMLENKALIIKYILQFNKDSRFKIIRDNE